MLSFFRRRSSRMVLASWLAACAVLLGMLAPAVSGVLAARGEVPFAVELCTAEGLVSPDDPAPHDPAVAAGHCPYCLTHAGSFALPVDLPGPVFSAQSVEGWGWALRVSSHPLQAAALLRVRGPPVRA